MDIWQLFAYKTVRRLLIVLTKSPSILNKQIGKNSTNQILLRSRVNTALCDRIIGEWCRGVTWDACVASSSRVPVATSSWRARGGTVVMDSTRREKWLKPDHFEWKKKMFRGLNSPLKLYSSKHCLSQNEISKALYANTISVVIFLETKNCKRIILNEKIFCNYSSNSPFIWAKMVKA
jgi:hypothetical protein